MTVTEAADRLARILDETPPRLAAISNADASRKPGPDRWAAKEILGHLIDSASHNHQRFVRGRLFASYDCPSYQQEQWVAAQTYGDEPWSDLVSLWLAYNRHLLHLMRTVREPALGTPIRLGGAAPVPLSTVMVDYVTHLEHHLGQILAPAAGQ